MFFVVFFILAVTLNAQEKKWLSKEEAGEFFDLNVENIENNIYEPRDRKGFREIRFGEKIATFPYYVSVKMSVVGGTYWVIQRPMTKFVARGDKVIGLYKCGNRISGFYRLPLLSSNTDNYPPPERSLAFKPEKGDKGDKGDPGRDGKDATFSWTPITIGVGTGIGVLVGGYGFRTTVTTTVTDVTIKPGIRLQTGDGTIIFGPDKTVITKHDINTKKFNLGAAIGCGIASGLITYLLNDLVF